MANNISQTAGWSYSKNGRVRSVATLTSQHTQTGDEVAEGVQNIGTVTHEALVLGDVATPGFAWFHNLDGTNFVLIGIDEAGTFHPFLKLLAGQRAQLWLYEAPYAKADTASCLLDYAICEV